MLNHLQVLTEHDNGLVARSTQAKRDRMTWPSAVLLIAGLSALAWGGIALLALLTGLL